MVELSSPLLKYFPELTAYQISRLNEYTRLLSDWNEKINLVSRKDYDNFELHHLVPSLAIRKIYTFPPQAKVADIGSGGGLPAIPLAILYPETHFTLIESITKKTKALKDMADRLELTNVDIINARAESLNNRFDIITGRAVTAFPEFLKLCRKLANKKSLIFYWTGYTELKIRNIRIHFLSDFFQEEYFIGKIIIEAEIIH